MSFAMSFAMSLKCSQVGVQSIQRLSWQKIPQLPVEVIRLVELATLTKYGGGAWAGQRLRDFS